MIGWIRRTHQDLRTLFREKYFKVGLLVFLIALASFGIGYLAGRDWTPAPIIIERGEINR